MHIPFIHRKSTRTRVLLPATLTCDGHGSPVTILDISSEGALIDAPSSRTAHDTVWLMWHDIECLSHVTWRRDNRFGLSFNKLLSDENLARIIAASSPVED